MITRLAPATTIEELTQRYYDKTPQTQTALARLASCGLTVDQFMESGEEVMAILSSDWPVQAALDGIKNSERLIRDFQRTFGTSWERKDDLDAFYKFYREEIPNKRFISAAFIQYMKIGFGDVQSLVSPSLYSRVIGTQWSTNADERLELFNIINFEKQLRNIAGHVQPILSSSKPTFTKKYSTITEIKPVTNLEEFGLRYGLSLETKTFLTNTGFSIAQLLDENTQKNFNWLEKAPLLIQVDVNIALNKERFIKTYCNPNWIRNDDLKAFLKFYGFDNEVFNMLSGRHYQSVRALLTGPDKDLNGLAKSSIYGAIATRLISIISIENKIREIADSLSPAIALSKDKLGYDIPRAEFKPTLPPKPTPIPAPPTTATRIEEKKLTPEEIFLQNCAPTTKRFITETCKNRKISNAEQMAQLNLTTAELKLFEKFEDPINCKVIERPVILGEIVYDLDTIINLNGKDIYNEPFHPLQVMSSHTTLNEFDKLVADIKKQRSEAKRALEIKPTFAIEPVRISSNPPGGPTLPAPEVHSAPKTEETKPIVAKASSGSTTVSMAPSFFASSSSSDGTSKDLADFIAKRFPHSWFKSIINIGITLGSCLDLAFLGKNELKVLKKYFGDISSEKIELLHAALTDELKARKRPINRSELKESMASHPTFSSEDETQKIRDFFNYYNAPDFFKDLDFFKKLHMSLQFFLNMQSYENLSLALPHFSTKKIIEFWLIIRKEQTYREAVASVAPKTTAVLKEPIHSIAEFFKKYSFWHPADQRYMQLTLSFERFLNLPESKLLDDSFTYKRELIMGTEDREVLYDQINTEKEIINAYELQNRAVSGMRP